MLQLAKPGEPLVLADGTKIDPATGEVIRDLPPVEEIPTNQEAQRELAKVRRTIRDLPEVPQKMNVISVVLSYELFGLVPRDIALATNLPVEQVVSIQQTDVYESYKQDILRRFEETEAQTVQNLLAKKALIAANKVITTMNSQNDALALKASQDVLDRSGHRPADIVEHRHRIEGGLKITYIRKTNDIPATNIIDGELADGS